MKIAIASSGLGHVARGIETWACDTAGALACARVKSYELSVIGGGEKVKSYELSVIRNTNNQEPITNNSASGSPNNQEQITNNSLEVTLFCAASLPTANCPLLTVRVLPSLKRGDSLAQFLTRIFPKWAWRFGLKSTYDLEQWSFWWHLWPKLRRGKFDIVHVQDPWLALLLERSGRLGLHPAKVILAHGTEEPLEFLEKFRYVQHLAPWHLEQAEKKMRGKPLRHAQGRRGPHH